MHSLTPKNTAVIAVVLLALASCKSRSEAPAAADSAAAASPQLPPDHVPVTRAVPLDPAAQAAIDSANALFSAKDYRGALAAYRRTLTLAPGHPAPWWGISMAANMLGDSALADTAAGMLRSRGVDPGQGHDTPPPATFNPHGGRTPTGS